MDLDPDPLKCLGMDPDPLKKNLDPFPSKIILNIS